MPTLARVAKNSFLYSASSILLRASSIIFFPIFSLYLTKNDYGILSITQSIGAIVTIFAGFELTRALTRLIFNKESNGTNEQTILFSTLISSVVLSLLVVTTMLLLGNIVLKPVLKDIPFYPYVFFYLLSIPFTVVVDNCRAFLKATHRGEKVFVLDMLFFGSNILLNLTFVVFFKMDVLGIISGILLNAIIFSIALVPVFYEKFTFSFNKNVAKNAFRYSSVLIPTVFAGMVLESIDKFFLNSYTGSSNSGTYYISLTFASIFSSIKESVLNAYTPWIFQNIKEKSEQELSVIMTVIFAGLGLLAIAISWFSKEALQILSSNAELVDAYKYIPLNIAAYYVIFLGQLYALKLLYYTKYMKYIVFTIILGIVFNILFSYLLIPVYGIHGASLSRYGSFLIHVFAIYYLCFIDKEKKEMFDNKKLFAILFIVSFFILLPFLDTQNILFFITKSILFLLLLVMAIFVLSKNTSIKQYLFKR